MDDKMDELTFNSICKIMKSLDIIGRQVAILSTNARLQQEYVRITARLEGYHEPLHQGRAKFGNGNLHTKGAERNGTKTKTTRKRQHQN